MNLKVMFAVYLCLFFCLVVAPTPDPCGSKGLRNQSAVKWEASVDIRTGFSPI